MTQRTKKPSVKPKVRPRPVKGRKPATHKPARKLAPTPVVDDDCGPLPVGEEW